jgi:mannose-6-phosphate isomerase-like protein (cupin superfamily)
MKVSTLKNLKYLKLEKENCLISQFDNTRNYNLVVVKLLPHETLTLHKHIRPKNGDEAFIFHEGGRFEITTDSVKKNFLVSHPVLIRFKSKEAHSVKNISDDILEFLGLYTPPFRKGEVRILAKK